MMLYSPEQMPGEERPELYRIALAEEPPSRFVTLLKRRDDVLSVAAKELVRLIAEAGQRV